MKKRLRHKDYSNRINSAVENLHKGDREHSESHVSYLYNGPTIRNAMLPLNILLTSCVTDAGIMPALAPKVI